MSTPVTSAWTQAGHSLGSPTDTVRRGQSHSNCGPCRDLPAGSRSRKRQWHSALGASDRGLREVGVELDMKGQKQLSSAVAMASALVQLEPWADLRWSRRFCAWSPLGRYGRLTSAVQPLASGGRAVDSRADPIPRSTSTCPLGCLLPLEALPSCPAEPPGTSGRSASEN